MALHAEQTPRARDSKPIVVRTRYRSTSIVARFLQLFYRPHATVEQILARPPAWREIAVFLLMVALLRTTLEAIWDLLLVGEFFNLLHQPDVLWGLHPAFLAFLAANIGTVCLRVVLFAFIAFAAGRFLGGTGHFQPLVRLYGVILGLFALTILPDYLSVFFRMPVISFRASSLYNPQIGIGQIASSLWLAWISCVVVRRVHRLKPFDALQVALVLTLANTGLLVIAAKLVLNVPILPHNGSTSFWIIGNSVTLGIFLLAAGVLYKVGVWMDRRPLPVIDAQVDFRVRGYFKRPRMAGLPPRLQFLWPLLALLIIAAMIVAGLAQSLLKAPRAHAAGWSSAPLWALRAEAAAPADYRPDRIVIRFRATATAGERAALLARHGLRRRTDLAHLDAVVAELPMGVSPRVAVAALAYEGAVAYAEPDYLVHATATYTPNDTYLTKPYATSHYGTVTEYGPQKINAPTAWGTYHASNTVKVAVIDTGIDRNHPDLSGRVLTGYNYIANNADTTDDNGHGTHVSGIAAATTDNKTGIASVCFNACVILPVKVLDSTGTGATSGVASGVTYAADQGSAVINLSLGSTAYSQALQDAVNYAWSKNAVIVAAGGNDGSTTVEYPAGDDHVLGIAATDASDADASYSDWGRQIAVAAPGDKVLSTMPTYAVNLTANSGYYQSYDALSGTSMAAPQVTGLAGLFIAASGGTVTNLAVYQAIQRGADAVGVSFPPGANGGWEPHNGYGRIDAGNTLNGTYRTATVGSIVGQVTDANGNALSGVQVSANGASVTTGSDGMYRIANLAVANSPYSVSASATGYSFTMQSVSITAGTDTFAVFKALSTTQSTTIQNGGFEGGSFSPWVTGGGAPTPTLSTAQVHTGTTSALLGQRAGAEPLGDSSLTQTLQISIPAGSSKAQLSFWYWGSSTDVVSFDWQECQIRNTSGTTLAQVLKVASNAQIWQQVTYDMTAYNGQTLQVYFNDHEDGGGDLTYMYLDDVSVTYQ